MKNKYRKIIIYALIFGIALGMGALLGKSLHDFGFMHILFIVIAIIPVFWLIVQIHESGHFLCGKLSGFKLLLFGIGPFNWRYENGKFKFSVERKKGYLGFCAMIPPSSEISPRRYLLYISGGVAANILTGIIVVALFFIFTIGNMYLMIFLWMLGFFSILVGLLNFVPHLSGNAISDGKIFWSIIDGDSTAKDFLLIQQFSSLLAAGKRPRETGQMKRLSGKNEDSESHEFTTNILMYQLFYAYDIFDIAMMRDVALEMESQIDKVSSIMLPGYKNELCCVFSFLGEKEKAEKYYADVWPDLNKGKDINDCRVKAYIAFYLKNDKNAARTYCEEGLKVAKFFPLAGQAIMEKELIERLLVEMA